MTPGICWQCVSGQDPREERRAVAGGSVKGKLDVASVALDVRIARVREALMQQLNDFILHSIVY